MTTNPLLPKIVWVRLDGLGDLLCTLPVEEYCGSDLTQLYWLVHSPWNELWSHAPSLTSRVFAVSSGASAWEKFKRCYTFFRQEQFSALCIYFAPWWVSFAAWMARIPVRVGRKSQWWSYIFLTHGLRQKRSRSERHEAEYNKQLAMFFWQVLRKKIKKNSPTGAKELSSPLLSKQKTQLNSQTFDEQITHSPSRFKVHWLTELTHTSQPCFTNIRPIHIVPTQHEVPGPSMNRSVPHKPYVLIHPGMKGSASNWPPSTYSTLIDYLVNHVPIVITGTSADSYWLEPLKEKWKEHPQVTFFIDQPLTRLIAVISAARVVIAPSTGIAHLSSACGTWVIGLYPEKRSQSPRRWRPLGEKVVVLSSFQSELADIKPAQVAEQALEIMQKANT